MNSKHSGWLLIISLFYTFFVIYGSLVPLQFQPMPLEIALARFKEISYLNLGIHSRADWVSNILLFIPLTFFWMAYFSIISRKFNLLFALVILFLSILLSLCIEFTQLFFPPRTVSLNDLIAETLGGFLGIIFWRQFGHYVITWLKNWELAQGNISKFEQLLYIYLFILFGYSVLPLDLTISPVEVYHKWTEGKVHLIPFESNINSDISELLYNFLSDIVIWIPVSLLWVTSEKKTPSKAIQWTWTAAFILEFLQLFVYSRVSDTTDLITAAIGAWLGVQIAIKWKPDTVVSQRSLEKNHLWLPIVFVIVWSIFLLVIYWYPYNFQSDAIFLKERLTAFLNVPFTAFYYGTEYRAITSFISKMAFFFPLGFLLALLSKKSFLIFKEKVPDKLFIFLSMSYITLFGLMVELGQAALPEKSVDSADCLVSIFGALLGYTTYRYIRAPKIINLPTHTITSNHSSPLSINKENYHLAQTKPLRTEIERSPVNQNTNRAIPIVNQNTGNTLFTSLGLPALGYFFIIASAPLIVNFLDYKENNSLLPFTDWLYSNVPTLLIWSGSLAGLLLGIQIHRKLAPSNQNPAVLIIISGFYTSFFTGLILMFSASLFEAIWAISFLMFGFLLSWPFNTLFSYIPNIKMSTELMVIFVFATLFLIIPTLDSHYLLSESLERLYTLIKSIILWIPIGTLATMTNVSSKGYIWIRGLFWSFWIIFLPVMMNLSSNVLFEVLAMPLGWAIGVWLVQGTQYEI